MPFIVFEGPDGTGKTSSAQSVYQALVPHYPTVLTREPGGTPIGNTLRTLMLEHECTPLTELLLISAARAEHARTIIRPALQQKQLVLCDRYIDSTYIYQGYIKGIPEDIISQVQKLIDPPIPDLVFFFEHRYRTDIADRLEALDQNKALNGYKLRQHRSSTPWIAVPRGNPAFITEFLTIQIKKFLA